MNYYVDCADTEAQECLGEFVDRINKQMTLNCQLPFSLPTAAIVQIVGEAKKWFYNNYEDAVEEIYITCPWEVFMQESFRTGLTNKDGMHHNEILKSETKKDRGVIVMPENVFSVIRVYQLDKFSGEAGWGGMKIDGGNRDFTARRLFSSAMYNSQLAISADNMIYWTCTLNYFDTARQMLQEMHGFSFNRLTHKLRFTGELPTRPCVFHTLTAIEDCAIFNDDLFFRMCVGLCMKNLSRVLGTFQYSLPGNVSINYDMIQSYGESEIQDVKDEILNMRHSVAYFYTT